MTQIYQYCCSIMGRIVKVRCRDGKVYVGKITRVTREHVHLTPIGRGIEGKKETGVMATNADLVGEGKARGAEILFFWPFILPLAAIAGISLLAAPFFWGPWFWF